MQVKIATWNVNSVLARQPQVLKWLETAQPDVVCMQEIKCVDDRFPREAFAELGYASEAFGQPTYNGVAILSKREITCSQRGFLDAEAGAHARLLGATVDGIRLLNVYIPNGQSVGSEKYAFKLDWIKRLRLFLDSQYNPGELVLLCGDFNVAPDDRDVHDPELWRGRIHFSEPEKEAIDHVKAWGFTDVFRMHHEEGGHYSWWDYRAGAFRRNLGLRIDHIWTTASLAERCTGIVIDKDPRRWEKPSDHAPVVVEIS
jgi:exodeoxyribonuclease-3